MATIHKNLSVIEGALPSASGMKFGIVVSEWNTQVTAALLDGAMRTLVAAGCAESDITVKRVPGTVELTLGAQFFAEYTDVPRHRSFGWGLTSHQRLTCPSCIS